LVEARTGILVKIMKDGSESGEVNIIRREIGGMFLYSLCAVNGVSRDVMNNVQNILKGGTIWYPSTN
jgi:hypothetical protein